mgnify:CR=1 FL=1
MPPVNFSSAGIYQLLEEGQSQKIDTLQCGHMARLRCSGLQDEENVKLYATKHSFVPLMLCLLKRDSALGIGFEYWAREGLRRLALFTA